MGLDMYLERFPRCRDCTPEEIYRVNELLAYEQNEDAKKKYSLEEWAGIEPDKVPSKELVEQLRPYFQTRFYYWDDEHRYPTNCVYEHVGYWRKANEIHDWFVQNVQDGIDDCNYHSEVTKELLERLRDTCLKILRNTTLVPGKIKNGYRYENGKEIPIEIDGLIVEDPTECERYLPTSSGFFFGSTSYDEYYIYDLKKTVQICDEVLESTDFETQMIFYCSSW